MKRKVEIVDDVMKVSFYCPVCSKEIYASNVDEVHSGEHDGFIFVHDDKPHESSDIDALENGIN